MTTNNPYIFGDPALDRERLKTQTRLFSDYIQANARRLVGPQIHSILDLGCGEGQLGLLLQDVYGPQTRLVGIDKDDRAIATAQQRAIESGQTTAEFRVNDVTALDVVPPGDFDLVYISLLLLHLQRVDKALALAYNSLRPGGAIWIKDIHINLRTAIKHPAFKKIGDIMGDAMTMIGVNSFISVEVPRLLQTAGFSDIYEEVEQYPLGGPTLEGQATLATILGAFHHARHMMSQMTRVPVAEIERLYMDICQHALYSRTEIGSASYANITARRPAR
jgi:SAM-dependent methyltransferase